MTTLKQDLRDVQPTRQIIALLLAVTATVPGLVLRFTEPHLAHHWEAFLYGLAIVGAAFLLSWAAEVAQLDVSAGLAIGLLALIAVLPEYAVDLVFAFKAGNAVQEFGAACRPPMADVESPCSLALANMTGANRLLIGIGWPMVVFIGWYRSRRLRRTTTRRSNRCARRCATSARACRSCSRKRIASRPTPRTSCARRSRRCGRSSNF